MDALKAASKELRAALGSGVIALVLDADAPQVWVTVSDDLVERGISAGDLVKVAVGAARGEGRRPAADGAGDGHGALRCPGRAGRHPGSPRDRGLMAFWRRIWQRDAADALAACTALDVGTEFAKALVFDIDAGGHGTVRGVGRKRQGLSHMQSGTVADIAAVVDNCAVALQEAEEMAGFRPTQVVIGIAGELVKGFTTTHSQERKKPDQPISEGELQKLIDVVQREALHEAERAITWETGLPHVDVRLVHAAVTGASIDGYALTNPVGFQGRHVKIGIFNAFAPLVHLGALQSVASQLDLELLEIVAEPYAVARVLGSDHIRQAGALFVDVGGGTTDVALVRQGGIEGTRMFALGGRAFTKSLADRLDLPFPRAEALKVDYARGLDGRERDGDRDASSPTTSGSGRPASSWSWRSCRAATSCPAASSCAAAARGCRRSGRRCRRRRSTSGCRSPGRPRSRSWRPTRSTRSPTRPTCSSTSRTSRRSASPSRRSTSRRRRIRSMRRCAGSSKR